jgi:hypothetical protein
LYIMPDSNWQFCELLQEVSAFSASVQGVL